MKRLLILFILLTAQARQVMGCGWFTALKNKFSRNRIQPAAPAAPAPTLRTRLSEAEREQLKQDVADADRVAFTVAILEMEAAKKQFPRAQ